MRQSRALLVAGASLPFVGALLLALVRPHDEQFLLVILAVPISALLGFAVGEGKPAINQALSAFGLLSSSIGLAIGTSEAHPIVPVFWMSSLGMLCGILDLVLGRRHPRRRPGLAVASILFAPFAVLTLYVVYTAGW